MPSPASNPAGNESELDRFHRIEDLFQRAADLPASERDARLVEWCAADDALLEEVRALLRSFEIQRQAPPAPADPWLGRVLGHYRIARLLGRGGMGAVYLASRIQGGFEQQVAIKLLGTRLTSRFHQERFLEERQILASLTHPNIAAMLDGGLSADGEPYLVMEYVDGVRLDVYAEQNRLSIRPLLDLFLQVCDAVDYAHRRLVVHRDLKPGNILVDASGRAKLLDFGTAKLLSAASPDGSAIHPTRGAMRAFTPEYASPEQMLGAAVTAATDVYSLGVVLYRLLTGRPPYRFDDLRDEDFFAAITRHPPLAPSVAITAPAPRETHPQRHFDATERRRALHGDLDAIVLKAMRVEPSDRYPDAASLADDIRNYMDARPVTARAPALTYRVSKFIRRNRAAVMLSGGLTIALVAGLAATIWQSRVAREEGLRATRQFENVRDLNRFLLIDFYDEVESLPGSTDVEKNLIAQSMSYLDRLQRQSPRDLEIQLDIIEALTKMGNLEGNPYSNNLSDPESAIRTLTKAENLAATLMARTPADVRVQKSYGLLERSLGEVHFGKGAAEPAIDHLQRAAPVMEKLSERPGAALDEICDAASVYGVLGDIYSGSFIGKLEPVKAAAYFEKQVELNRKALRIDPEFARGHRGVAIGLMKTGTALQETHTSHAIGFFDSALAESNQLERKGPSFPNQRLMALLHNHLAEALSSVSRFGEAYQHARDALQINQRFIALDPSNNRALIDVANSWYHCGEALQMRFNELGRPQDAVDSLAAYGQSLAFCRKILLNQPDNPIWNGEISDILSRMSMLLRKSGRAAEAERDWTESRDLAIQLAEPAAAIESNLERAAALFASASLPRPLWDLPRSLRYAERLNQMSQFGNPGHLYLLARAQRLNGRETDARSNLEKAAAKAPPPESGEVKTRLRSNIEEELAALGK